MPCFSKIISEMLPEIQTIEKFDFLKSMILSQMLLFSVLNKGVSPQKQFLPFKNLSYSSCKFSAVL